MESLIDSQQQPACTTSRSMRFLRGWGLKGLAALMLPAVMLRPCVPLGALNPLNSILRTALFPTASVLGEAPGCV